MSFICCTFAIVMNLLTRLFVWLSRLHHCRGFGIQSPTDYWLVRYDAQTTGCGANWDGSTSD